MHRKKRIYKGGYNEYNEYIENLPLLLLEYKDNYTNQEKKNIDEQISNLKINIDIINKTDNELYNAKVNYIFKKRLYNINDIIEQFKDKFNFYELKELKEDLDKETNKKKKFTKLIEIENYVNKLNQIINTDNDKFERLKFIDYGIKKFSMDIPSKNQDNEAKKINCKSLVDCDESMLLGYELRISHYNTIEKITNLISSYQNNEYLKATLNELNTIKYNEQTIDYYIQIDRKLKRIKENHDIAIITDNDNIKKIFEYEIKLLNYDILEENNKNTNYYFTDEEIKKIEDAIKNNDYANFTNDEKKKILNIITKQKKYKETIDLYIDYKLKNYNKSILNMFENILKLLEKKKIEEIYKYYIELFKDNLKNTININKELLYNCFCFFNIKYDYLKDNFKEKILNKIEIKKINDKYTNNTNNIDKIYFININGDDNINVYNKSSSIFNFPKKKESSSTFKFDDIKSLIKKYIDNYNLNEKTDEKKIGNLDFANYYEIIFNNKLYNNNKSEKIILCTLISNSIDDEKIKELKFNIDCYYKLLLSSLIIKDFNNDIDENLKEILILLKLYIDWHLETHSITGGSSIKNSYQLYMNDKNRYYISYNNKNIYLNKNNTYKKKNKLYLKINNETEVIIKT